MTAAPQQPSADAFLLGGGGQSATFDGVGDSVTGTVESTEVRQQTDFQSGQPKTWDDGSPVMQLVVSLQTTLRDDADDDGIRKVYVKGSKKPGSQSLHDAVATAVRQAGAKGLEEGGTLTVTYTGDEPPKTRGMSPRKLYSATYEAPDKAAATGDFLGTAPAQQQAPAPQAAPAAQPAAAPQPGSPEQAAAFQAWLATQQQGS